MEKRKSLFLSASVYYALVFMAGGGYISYIGLYYASVNLNNSQIGLISSIGLLVGMLAQPMWGTIADRSKNKTFILNALVLVSSGLVGLNPLSGSYFFLILISIAVFQFAIGVFNSFHVIYSKHIGLAFVKVVKV